MNITPVQAKKIIETSELLFDEYQKYDEIEYAGASAFKRSRAYSESFWASYVGAVQKLNIDVKVPEDDDDFYVWLRELNEISSIAFHQNTDATFSLLSDFSLN